LLDLGVKQLSFLLLIPVIFIACRGDGLRPCKTELRCTAFADMPDYQDSIMQGDEVTLVMDFFPQDERGKVLVLPLDFRYEWGILLYRLNQTPSGQVDTLIYDAVAALGEIREIQPTYMTVRASRSGNMQQARISFRLMKPGTYNIRLMSHFNKVEVGKWGECDVFASFNSLNVAQLKGPYPQSSSGYTIVVKS